MSKTTRWITALLAASLAAASTGCDESKDEAPAPRASGKSKATAAVSAPAAATSAPAPKKTVKKPSHPCPKGSEGEGTFNKPCEATGTTRIMDVAWNRKEVGEKGPTFRVINKSDLEILYGRIVVYFYDKAGKQLEVAGGGKKRKTQTCGGNIFAGAVKPGEKIFVNFSCVKKKHVPEGFKTIEAEIQMVGFTDESGKRSDTYWRNKDLTPDERPKGGIKAKKTK